MRVRYSFIIDEDPRFIIEGQTFLRSILAAGVRPEDIVAQVTGRSGEGGKRLAARFGVRTIDLPLGPDGRYCNKINQLFTLGNDQDFDVLVACDTDLAITRPLDRVARQDCIRARRVDQENPPMAVLEQIRGFLGFSEQPPLAAPGCCPTASTYAMNCNGGVLLIPRQYMKPLGEAWLAYAQVLTDHRELLQQWVNHIDQVSWMFAMLKLGLPFDELPVEYNFPTNLAKRIPKGTYARPAVLHYHRSIDPKGRIRSSGVRLVDESIKEANRRLRSSSGSAWSAVTLAGFGERWVLPTAAALLALATVAGAFGAHVLAGHWSARRAQIYEIAVRYQFFQSLGLLVMGTLLGGARPENPSSAGRFAVQSLVAAPRALLVGIALFCGSLYALSLDAPPWVGILTPIGGGLLILAWLLFAYSMWRARE